MLGLPWRNAICSWVGRFSHWWPPADQAAVRLETAAPRRAAAGARVARVVAPAMAAREAGAGARKAAAARAASPAAQEAAAASRAGREEATRASAAAPARAPHRT